MADIPRKLIDQMFARMRKSGIAVDQPLLWGYFFTATDRSKLERAAELLALEGYQIVGIASWDKKAVREPDGWTLHVERVEHHSVDSLCLRNAGLEDFADAHRLDSYDGMDVGVAPQQSQGLLSANSVEKLPCAFGRTLIPFLLRQRWRRR